MITRIFIVVRYWYYVIGSVNPQGDETGSKEPSSFQIYVPYTLYYPLLIPNLILGTALFLYVNWVLEQLFIHNP